MPSNMMDQQGLYSSSYFSDEVHFPSERQVGFWKKENTIGRYEENKMAASSPFKKLIPLESQDEEFLGHTKPHLNCDQKVNIGPGIPTAGMGGPASYSSVLLGPADCGQRERTNLSAQTRSYLVEGEKINMMGAQYENSLFSSSFSDLFTRKLELSANNALLGHSVDTVANYEEVEPFGSLEEIEAQTIGNLLPNDDELLSGVADGLDYIIQPGGADDIEDLDLFSSLGGMDLEDESSSVGQRCSEDPKRTFSSQIRGSSGSIAAPHPFGEQPSRTLFVRNVNSNVEDSELRALFEQYGDIWTLYTVCKHRGFVMVSYYDLRAAQNAMRTLQNAPLRRRKLDIHFSIPKDIPSEKDINQGTLLVFNLDSSVPNDEIHQIFGVYGEIKEIWESHGHKFIEFYDIRAAESALRALNRSDIAGKQIKLEHSRLGGARRLMQHLPSYLEQNDSSVYLQPNSSPNTYRTGFSHEALTSGSMDYETILGVRSAVRAPITPFLGNTYHGISSSVTERADSVGDQSGLIEPDQSQGHWKFNFQGTPVFHPHSLPEYHDGLTNGVPCKSPGPMATNISSTPSGRFENGQMHGVNSNGHSVELNEGVFGSSEIGSFPFSGHQYTWNNICPPRPPGMMWPNSPSFVNGVCTAPASQVHGVPNAPSHILSTVAALTNYHAGSAPAVNPPLWERRHSYAGQSPEASGFLSGSLGRVNSPHPLDFHPPNIFPSVSRNSTDLQIPPKNVRLHSRHQRCLVLPERGQMIPLLGSFDSPNERGRSRRNESGSNLADRRQFELDLDRIVRGEDSRTTLMIKNIPNKYTSKMLLATIDEHHRGTYDFLYLPIDFKNKCNVGYAFINMTDPSQIIPFYQALNGKKWEKFNSEKVASLAYARIQGKAALISHFQHSSLMNEDKRCRPILFHTDGPNAGNQVPFPMGVSIRSRPGKSRTNTIEENHYQENTSNLENGEESCSRGSSSGSAKELD